MVTTTQAKVSKDLAKKKITVRKHFNARPEAVWQAWTSKDILDQWWAPKPWRAETKSLEFQEGGSWLYAMVGPDNERHYARVDYTSINAPTSFEGTDTFTDEQGVTSTDMPQTSWKVEFKPSGDGTDVTITITSTSKDALEKMLEMGFEEGFQSGLSNLDEYFERNVR